MQCNANNKLEFYQGVCNKSLVVLLILFFRLGNWLMYGAACAAHLAA